VHGHCYFSNEFGHEEGISRIINKYLHEEGITIVWFGFGGKIIE
jgi:hypothetical protein